MTTTKSLVFLLAMVGMSLCGCSDGASGGSRVPVYHVTGKVTMSGGPLVGAVVAFAPKDKQPVAIGRTDDAGNYTLTTYDAGDGAAAGDYAVTVLKVAASAAAADPTGGHGVDAKASAGHASNTVAAAGNGNLVPAIYADSEKTPLSFNVEAKANTYDIDIK